MKKKEINSKRSQVIGNKIEKGIKNKQEIGLTNKVEIDKTEVKKTKEVILSKEFRENRVNNSNINIQDKAKYEDLTSNKNRNVQRSIFINEVKKEEKKEDAIKTMYVPNGYSSPKVIPIKTNENINRIIPKVEEQKVGVKKEILYQKNNGIKNEIKREVGVSQKPSNSNISAIDSNKGKEVILSKEFRENKFGASNINSEIKVETKLRNIPIVQEKTSQKIVSSKIREIEDMKARDRKSVV